MSCTVDAPAMEDVVGNVNTHHDLSIPNVVGQTLIYFCFPHP